MGLIIHRLSNIISFVVMLPLCLIVGPFLALEMMIEGFIKHWNDK